MSDAFKLGRIASLQAEMYAAVARIEGMKALNQWRESRGESQAYDETAFLNEGKTLEYIAMSLREVADV